MIKNAASILRELTESSPCSLQGLPSTYGIYALWDHTWTIRYIGCTPKATEGFNIRVGRKHVAGSEGMSHKFSHAYCVERMWRYSKRIHPDASGSAQSEADASLAKRLRTLFIRKHCRVSLVEISPTRSNDYFRVLTDLECEVKALAPSYMKSWDGTRFKPEAEPIMLVDEVLSAHPELVAASNRQQTIYRRLVDI